MMIGVVHFIGTGFSLFLLSKVEVFNLQALVELGSTNPPFFIFLSVVAVFDLCVYRVNLHTLLNTRVIRDTRPPNRELGSQPNRSRKH